MFTVDKEKARKILIDEFHYKKHQVDAFLESIPELDDIFKPAVERWLSDRTVLDLSVEGLTISQVMATRKSSFLTAVRDLNILLRSDYPEDFREKFKQALQQPIEYK